jgi:site-specific DNA-methyltransferase (adenine-specific)
MNKLYLGDCLDVMKIIPSKSIDMVLADLPYGTTNCHWDSIIPMNKHIIVDGKVQYENEFLLEQWKDGKSFEFARDKFNTESKNGLWQHYERIIKNNGVICLTSQEPFTSKLVMSNPKMFRYDLIWQKTLPKGHLNAKKMPMRAHENILIFYKSLPTYNPQKTTGHNRKVANTRYEKGGDGNSVYGKEVRNTFYDSDERYPTSVQTFSNGNQIGKLHPTQKTIELLEWLIKTYTNEGDVVLDNTMGVGSTIVASINTNRQYIGIEKDEKYFHLALNWIESLKK